MFIILMPRIGVPHIFSSQSNKQYRLLCNKNILKENVINTISSDMPLTGICTTCFEHAKLIYEINVDEDPRVLHNQWQTRLPYLREYHYQEILGPAPTSYDMIYRSWNKLAKAKRAIKK